MNFLLARQDILDTARYVVLLYAHVGPQHISAPADSALVLQSICHPRVLLLLMGIGKEREISSTGQ